MIGKKLLETRISKKIIFWITLLLFILIQDDIRKLKLFYEKNDWFHFDLQQKAMIISAKTYYHNGRTELNIYNALANKYQ